MKKIYLSVFLGLCSLMSFAQSTHKGNPYVGVHVKYGTVISTVGLGVKGGYSFTDHWRGQASANVYLVDGLVWDANIDAHYLFPINPSLQAYPLAGINLSGGAKLFGVNVGGGIEWKMNNRFSLNGEAKYQLLTYSQPEITIGVSYHF